MLGKKLIASAMASGLLWAAGFAGQAAVASHPGFLLLAGQARLFLGDKEGGLRLMQQAAEKEQASQPEPAAGQAAAPASAIRVASPVCLPSGKVRRASARSARPAPPLVVAAQALPPDFAVQMARRQRELARLTGDQARIRRQVHLLVAQYVHELPQPPAVPAEPLPANP